MQHALLLTVRFHDGRYNGAGDWPPSPARLFQAMLAGAARGKTVAEEDRAALAWLERLAPPVVAAPAMRPGSSFINYVPNNDLDAVEGDPRRIGEIRAPKRIKPRLFDARQPFLYLWTFDHGVEQAKQVCSIAERLYQLGRGVDMAFASGEILSAEEAEARLASHCGSIHRPSEDGQGRVLACPALGSLESLIRRHKQTGRRFQTLMEPSPTRKEPSRMKAIGQVLAQPSKARFRQVLYDSPPARRLFELRKAGEDAFAIWPLRKVALLVETIRDMAADKLEKILSAIGKQGCVARVFGRCRDASEADKAQRIRIIPLPSIGHAHADRGIRRVLVEIPSNCPLRADDIAWAFSGLDYSDPDTGEILWNLVPADNRDMLRHYGIGDEGEPSRLWRTVTPVALPLSRRCGRISGKARRESEGRIACAVREALRHAGISEKAVRIRVQREPFEGKGERAEAFAHGARFPGVRLTHVEIAFAEPVRGPLLLGDGRYLGLGLLRPVREAARDALVFPVPREAQIRMDDRAEFLRAVRRALMSLARDGNGAIPRLFSGHEADGAPASSGHHDHVFLAADDADGDGLIDHLLVAAPWLCDRTAERGRGQDRLFERVVLSLESVRAGRLGVIILGRPHALEDGDRLAGPSQLWESRTPYHPARHASRGKDAAEAAVADLVSECERRGLPRPEAQLLELKAGPNGGNPEARFRLRFAVAVEGPILLGRDSHKGGGLFAAARPALLP